MFRCARLMTSMRELRWWGLGLLVVFLMAWFVRVMMCVGHTLKPTPWLTGYHTVARACAGNGWFGVDSSMLSLWGAITVVYIPLGVWEIRKRKKEQGPRAL